MTLKDATIAVLAGLVLFVGYLLLVGVGIAVVLLVAATVLELFGVNVPVLAVVA